MTAKTKTTEGAPFEKQVELVFQEFALKKFEGLCSDPNVRDVYRLVEENSLSSLRDALRWNALKDASIAGVPLQMVKDLTGNEAASPQEIAGALDCKLLQIFEDERVEAELVSAVKRILEKQSGYARKADAAAEWCVGGFLSTGSVIQEDGVLTAALMKAVFEEVPWVPYNGRKITFKELVQREYFGSVKEDNAMLAYLDPKEWDETWSQYYDRAVEKGSINAKEIGREEFLAKRRTSIFAVASAIEGGESRLWIMGNGGKPEFMRISYMLGLYVHEYAHIYTSTEEAATPGRHCVLYEGLAEDASRKALSYLEKTFPGISLGVCSWLQDSVITEPHYVFGRILVKTIRESMGEASFKEEIPNLVKIGSGSAEDLIAFLKKVNDAIHALQHARKID